MRYRNVLLDKTSVIESKLKVLKFVINTQHPIGEYLQTIDEIQTILEEIQSFIENEEKTPGELNREF